MQELFLSFTLAASLLFRCQVRAGEPSVCMSNDFRCDRYPDCIDSADEDATCNYTCVGDQFICNSGPIIDLGAGSGQLGRGYCLSQTHKCDGVPQCVDHSDESTCADTCNTYLPSHRCRSGLNVDNTSYCIAEHQWCDGVANCADQSDEDNCRPETCGSDFLCSEKPIWYKHDNTRWCLLSSYVCDQFTDCGDFSDERDCEYEACETDNFKCGHKNSTRGPICIPLEGLCNGANDCASGVEERGCEALTSSSCDRETSLPCHDGNGCMLLGQRCDGIEHCADASDELLCSFDEEVPTKR